MKKFNDKLTSFYTLADVPAGEVIREKIVSRQKQQEATMSLLNEGFAKTMEKTKKIDLTDYKLDQLVLDLKKVAKADAFNTMKGIELKQVAHIALDMLSKEKDEEQGYIFMMARGANYAEKLKEQQAKVKRLENYIATISELAGIAQYKGNSVGTFKGWV